MDSIYKFKTPEKLSEDLKIYLSVESAFDSKAILLRRFKQEEELRIGVRFLIKETDLEGTLLDLSNLADVYLEAAYNIACEELNRKNKSSNY